MIWNNSNMTINMYMYRSPSRVSIWEHLKKDVKINPMIVDYGIKEGIKLDYSTPKEKEKKILTSVE